MIKTENCPAADAIISHDASMINGIADYRIVDFTPARFCDTALSKILN